ncbi:MAG: DUF1858 domain-containing protein [Actinobacteria bacterium]|nr:DUF1858 domain-containing protein [Actinomycetota bacterium]
MKKIIVKEEDIIGKVIDNYPEASIVMLNYGLRCVGCFAGKFESIREGAKSHGMTNEQIKKMVKEINKAINQ